MGACAVVSGWSVTDQTPVEDVAFDELCDGVARELGVELTQAQAAVKALTLTREGLAAERVQPWKAVPVTTVCWLDRRSSSTSGPSDSCGKAT